VWRDGERAGLRTETGDVVIEAPAGAKAGDLVDGERIERAYPGGEYPGRESEVARLPRARLDNLMARARATAAVREFFAARGFVEVDVPLRVRAPGLEVHLDAVAAGEGRWLITSPEYQMKRLLAAGLERIVAVCRCFRAGEVGPEHQPEFTMIEWYRAWSDLEAVLADTEELVAHVARAVRGAATARVGGRTIDVTPPWPRMTVADAMARWAAAGLPLDGDEAALASALAAAGLDTGAARAWDDLFYAAFVARVEPRLRELERPLVLTDWPVRLGALARRSPSRPDVVERFEAYVGGVELCNAFGELTDPVEQRARFEDDRRQRAARGKPVHPIDDKLIAALAEGLPPSAGNAVGLDRLVMLVTGASSIRDVAWFTDPEL
jgi:elongation factor P--(R)-beta-lysine ligase